MKSKQDFTFYAFTYSFGFISGVASGDFGHLWIILLSLYGTHLLIKLIVKNKTKLKEILKKYD